MQLDQDGVLHFGRNMEGAITHSVASGLDRRWKIPSVLSHAELSDFAKKLLRLLERVHKGLRVEWDSNHSNLLGRLNVNAEKASEAIQHECAALFEKLEWHEVGVYVVQPHEAFEYDDLADFGLHVDISNEDTRKVAARLVEAEEQHGNVMVYGDVFTYLKERIKKESSQNV